MTADDTGRVIDSLREQFTQLLRGETGSAVEYGTDLDPELQALCETANQLVTSFNEARNFIQSLAEGRLKASAPSHNLLVSPFKQLQANLLHLTWQTKQIAEGDFKQRVYFMGDFATAFNTMVEALEEKNRVERSLRDAQAKVRQLEGIIPICMYCKKIRDDGNYWQQLEQYISEHSDAHFSHGICPACFEERLGGWTDKEGRGPAGRASTDEQKLS
jgi:methyl-accepting chemotaxis protein